MFVECLSDKDIFEFAKIILNVKVLKVTTNIGYTDFVAPNFKYTACIEIKNGKFFSSRIYAEFDDQSFTIREMIPCTHAWKKFMTARFGQEYVEKYSETSKTSDNGRV